MANTLKTKEVNRLNTRKAAKPIFDAIWVWTAVLIVAYLLKFLPLYALPIAFCLMGILQYHLNILGHDGVHGLLFESTKINKNFTRWFILGPQLIPFENLKSNHMNHHRKVGDFDDPDRQYYRLDGKDTKWRMTAWILSSFLGRMILPIGVKLLHTRKHNTNAAETFSLHDIFSLVGTQLVLITLFWMLTDTWTAYLIFWFLPIFTIMFGLNCTRSCLEHLEGHNGSHLWTFASNRAERFFLSPFNMNYHLEHHRYPYVPYYNLPKLRNLMLANEEILPDQVCPSYLGRLAEIKTESK